MQYETKRRPGNNPPNPVTGFPSQQKRGQQTVPGGRPAPLRKNAAQATPTRRTTTGYAPLASSFRQTTPSKQAASPFTTGTSGVPRKPFHGKFPFNATTRKAEKMPGNRFTTGRTQQPVSAPARGDVISPIFRQTTFYSGYPPAITAAPTGISGNQRPYIFDPVPDIPPKTQPGTGGGSIPNPNKTPGNIPDKQPCTCGQTGNGCTVLEKFVKGSSALTTQHKSQIADLVKDIERQQIKFVVLTGHTDASGAEDYNLELGYNRAKEVRYEITKQLHLRNPWSFTPVFWKTETRGEAEPVSATHDELNRRVVVCLKQTPD